MEGEEGWGNLPLFLPCPEGPQQPAQALDKVARMLMICAGERLQALVLGYLIGPSGRGGNKSPEESRAMAIAIW